MALPLERFFMLIEIILDRRDDEARDKYTRTAFLAWENAQHRYAAMFAHVAMTTITKEKEAGFKKKQQEFWKAFPDFAAYLRKLGITRDE